MLQAAIVNVQGNMVGETRTHRENQLGQKATTSNRYWKKNYIEKIEYPTILFRYFNRPGCAFRFSYEVSFLK